MGKFEQTLRPLLAHPKRGWIVTGLTLLIALVTVWPAVDHYLAARQQEADTRDAVAQAEEDLASLPGLRGTVEAQLARLANLEKRCISGADVNHFREELLDMARRSGCRVEGIELADAQRRAWRENDNVITPVSAGEQHPETPFELTSQNVSVSLAGPLDRVREFLAEFQKTDRFCHADTLGLRPMEPDRKEVVLELTVTLYSLERKTPAAG